MNRNPYDIIFIGGGLANGLMAHRYTQTHPDARVLIIEKTSQLGGNHTWSFHDTDLTESQHKWVKPFISQRWDSHEVRFPQLVRHVQSGYNAVLSDNFHTVISQSPQIDIYLDQHVVFVGAHGVNLRSGEYLEADTIIDGTGWTEPETGQFGYQKFFGLDVTLEEPHWITSPILMDANVSQEDGFRFFYILPWSDRRLLIEDTRYSNNSDLFTNYYKADILKYIKDRGWSLSRIDREESGVLPVPMTGTVPEIESKAAVSGMKAWYFHPTTGYSFPWAVRYADAVSQINNLSTESLKAWLSETIQSHWIQGRFYRILNRMMFRAATPEKRFQILEKFYSLPPDSIARFYSGHLNRLDTFKILSGRPPVPIVKALQCLFETTP